MSYCEHCEGQRFDRARVLRALREVRKHLQAPERHACEKALAQAIEAVRTLDIPHLELFEGGDEIVH